MTSSAAVGEPSRDAHDERPDDVDGIAPSDTDTPLEPHRDADGRFASRNGVAVKTALRAHRADLPAAFHAVDDDVHHFLEQSLIDDGGRDDMPTRRRSQHQYRAALHRQLLQLNVALETRGLFDKRGRLRVAWLSKLESLMREARAFDHSLGLERRARQVSLNEYLSTEYSTASDTSPGTPPEH